LQLKKEQQNLKFLKAFYESRGHGILLKCTNLWEEMNWRYYNGNLSPILISVGITPYGASAGYYRPIEGNPGQIVLHQSMDTPTAAVLHHEMQHQAQHELGLLQKFPRSGGKGDPNKPDIHYCESWTWLCQHSDTIDGLNDRLYVWWKQSNRSDGGKRTKTKRYFDLKGESYWEKDLPENTFTELSTWESRTWENTHIE